MHKKNTSHENNRKDKSRRKKHSTPGNAKSENIISENSRKTKAGEVNTEGNAKSKRKVKDRRSGNMQIKEE